MSPLSFFPDWLNTNPYFSAGFGLAGIGFAASVARGVFTTTKILTKKRFLTSLEIPSKDHSYQWVMQWIINNQQSRIGGKSLSDGVTVNHLGLETTHCKDMVSGRMITRFDFVPSPGRHVMFYKNKHFLLIDRDRSSQTVDITTGAPWETLTLTTFSWNHSLFKNLLDEARTSMLEKEKDKTIIFNPLGSDWRPFGQPKPIRPFDSVILDQGISEKITQDLHEFLDSSVWYKTRGIPYRRGYLLYGPPGTGKTSYCLAIAGALKYHIATINLADPSLSDDRLLHLLAHLPPETILLLEDVDAAIEPDTGVDTGYRRLSFSGLLNALDGVASTDERIIFMTSNRFHLLPQALIRPGRVDVQAHIGLASNFQLERMYLRFFPEEPQKATKFASILEGAPLSMAEVQSFFLFFKDDPQACLTSAVELAKEAKQKKATKLLKQ